MESCVGISKESNLGWHFGMCNYLSMFVNMFYLSWKAHDLVTFTLQFIMQWTFDILEAFNAKKKVISSVAMKYVYADKEGQDDQTPCDQTTCFKYGLDPQRWVEFAASCKTPTWQVRCGCVFLQFQIELF